MCSVRRVSEYSSSFIDLKDYTRKDIYPSDMINHHAPLTPRSTQPTGLFKRAAYSKELQTVRGAFYRRVFRGEGETVNFKAILN